MPCPPPDQPVPAETSATQPGSAAEKTGESKPCTLGVLFVHGIGTRTRGSTLTDFGNPLVGWLQDVTGRMRERFLMSHTVLDDGSREPASSKVIFTCRGDARSWLLAESWWAQSFPPAQFQDVREWSQLITPWTTGRHFARRLWQPRTRKRIMSWPGALAALICGLLLSPLILLAMATLQILARIPWAPLRSALARAQLTLAASLGDSYLLVSRPIEAAAIRSRVRRDLDWIEKQCSKVAVIAHSQGAAIACQVLSTGRERPNVLLVTYGSGLRKLVELEDVRQERGMLRGALFSASSLLISALAIVATALVAFQASTGNASPAGVIALAVLVLLAVLPGIAGAQDFIQARESNRLRVIATGLAQRGVRWEDIYSSADPVPNGRMRDDESDSPKSIEVVNLGSVLHDHTSYWQNRDEFVPLVGRILTRFDRVPLRGAPSRAALAFLRAHRSIRINVRHALNWATVACVVALLLAYRSEWLTVTAWASQRVLTWTGRLVGYVPFSVPAPDAAAWRLTVGWLAGVLAANWLARTMWLSWNDAAMDRARRSVYRADPPFWVLLFLFLQLLITTLAVLPTDRGVGIAMGGSLLLLAPIVYAQRRHRPPRATSSAVQESIPSSFVVARALAKLVGFGIVAAALIAVARRLYALLSSP